MDRYEIVLKMNKGKDKFTNTYKVSKEMYNKIGMQLFKDKKSKEIGNSFQELGE